MVKAREATGLPIVYELMSEDRIPEFEEYVDVVQIGARNMQNFQLLKAVRKMHKPVLLKRGLCNTIEEWIMSAEYIMAGGNEQDVYKRQVPPRRGRELLHMGRGVRSGGLGRSCPRRSTL